MEMLRNYSVVQHLTSEEARKLAPYRPANQATFAIPNFVDIEMFCEGDQGRARQRFNIPDDAFVFLCCAANSKKAQTSSTISFGSLRGSWRIQTGKPCLS